ncbi:5'-3' exonuclease [Cryobacterium tepidiphilum]|uniref:5'-3' exonuclease n=1 Tax=Cryobacterium tepidiphilum TaxID=2486026 RepID=A0A3M8KVS6_9MICO|nr:5'-3' exonuclease H3TH domain-containing protein [Cryobacterium tepidiphilum]RNE56759.1 flap endonuclease [Cryobacterium tepidiphilum]
MTERLMLLDAASLYFRAFYGVPDTVRAPNGTPVNAVRGFLDIIARLVTEFRPTHLVACWDDDWRPQWRVDLIPSYKAHRVAATTAGTDVEETPDLLDAQIPVIRETLHALGICILGAPDHEADDVVGSLARQADVPVDIVTGDRDLFQLVDDARGARVIYTARGMSKLELVTDEVVRSKYGIDPGQYADFAVMRGDASDGLPGVAGVGEKTAANLLREYGDLAGIVAAAGDSSIPMSASLRLKIKAADAYLAVAPKVVEVVPDLGFLPFDARIRPLAAEQRAAMERLTEQWGLGGSAKRVMEALDQAAG